MNPLSKRDLQDILENHEDKVVERIVPSICDQQTVTRQLLLELEVFSQRMAQLEIKMDSARSMMAKLARNDPVLAMKRLY